MRGTAENGIWFANRLRSQNIAMQKKTARKIKEEEAATEAARLEALRRYRLLDSGPDAAFDALTRLTAQVCEAPVAWIGLVDEGRVYYKSAHGVEISEAPRAAAASSQVILQRDLFVIPDLSADPRYANAPFVNQPPYFRFYAAVPLITVEGFAIGALCVLDHGSRGLTAEQEDGLKTLAQQVMAQIELRSRLPLLERNSERLELVAQGAFDGLWDWDLRTGEVYYSPRWKAMLGYADAELENSVAVWTHLIHPEDAPNADAALQKFFASRETAYEIEYRMRHKSGCDRWIHSRGVLKRGADGTPLRFAGINADITDRRELHHAMEGYIEERTANLQDAIEMMQQGIVERSRAEAEVFDLNRQLEQRLQRIAALRAIDMAISASLDLRHTLGVFLDQTLEQLHVSAANVLIYSPYTYRLEFAVGRGFATSAMRYTRLQIGAGHAGKAALDRCIVHIEDLADDPGAFAKAPQLMAEGFAAYMAVPLIAKGQVKGVLEMFHREKFEDDFEWRDFLETLAGQAAIAIDNAQMFENLQRSNLELTLAYDATIEGWSRALDLRDHETEGHTQRVTALTLELAREMGLSESELVSIRRGALLHDIGKVGIPDEILHKPGALSHEEREVMCLHTQYAHQMLAPIAFLRSAMDIPYCHHEKWDGAGYPRGLKGEEIPLAARIFSVVDVWDALRSERPYKKAWTVEAALQQIRAMAGTHFDPAVVETFLRVIASGAARENPLRLAA